MEDNANYANHVGTSKSSTCSAKNQCPNQSEKMELIYDSNFNDNSSSFHDEDFSEKYNKAGLRHRQIPRLKPGCARFYDPVTKHYYKTSDIFEAEPAKKVIRSGVWYPENCLSYRTFHDPRTGEYYKVDKMYDDRGNYKIRYHKMVYRPRKPPGSDYYKACYLLEDDS
ncbi:MAG: hypothetical protein QW303_03055 [Nitrososphaerota archaeon]